MPGAGDHAVFEVTSRQRCAHVWAKIVNGLVGTFFAKYGDDPAVNGEGFAGTLGNRANLGDGRVCNAMGEPFKTFDFTRTACFFPGV